MTQAHSRWGGSAADRYMNCAGSAALIATVPPKPSSSYADEGTLAHEFAAYFLAEGERDALQHTGMFLNGAHARDGTALSDEMARAVQMYLDAVWAEFDKTPSAELYVEERFELQVDSAPGEVFGTTDALVYHRATGRLVVFDYKHGVGVSVTADDNAQLKFYAAGAVFSHADWPISELELVIVQPRARDAEEIGAVRTWPMNVLDLMEFQSDVDAAIEKAKSYEHDVVEQLMEGDGKVWDVTLFSVGKWCRWCDAAAVCPARERQVLEAAQLDFRSITEIQAEDLPEPKHYDTDRLGEILKAAYILSDWLKQIEEHVEGLVTHGTPVKGWKAVEKLGRAKWSDADATIVGAAEMMFGVEPDEIWPRKLATLGDVQKTLKLHGASKDDIAGFLASYTKKESSGLTLAPESDKRPAVDAAARDFASLNLGGLED